MTYYSEHREERKTYQNNNPKHCVICGVNYTNGPSHLKNPKYQIKHQTHLHNELKKQK